MPITVSSTAFAHGSPIPKKHTCDAADVSPPLAISGVPAGAGSLMLICDDPDAPMGTWDHWLVFNLPPDTAGLPEECRVLPGGARHGRNSWGRTAWGGPCPPRGMHRYYFRVYALDTHLTLPEGARKKELLAAMDGHILDQGELMGTYAR